MLEQNLLYGPTVIYFSFLVIQVPSKTTPYVNGYSKPTYSYTDLRFLSAIAFQVAHAFQQIKFPTRYSNLWKKLRKRSRIIR